MTTDTTTIHIAGITITAPTDLVSAAGWHVQYDGDSDRWIASDASHNGYVTRRLLRALHECYVSGQDGWDEASVRRVMCAAVTIGEVESAEARRDQARIRAAELQAKAAADQLRSVELTLAATK